MSSGVGRSDVSKCPTNLDTSRMALNQAAGMAVTPFGRFMRQSIARTSDLNKFWPLPAACTQTTGPPAAGISNLSRPLLGTRYTKTSAYLGSSESKSHPGSS